MRCAKTRDIIQPPETSLDSSAFPDKQHHHLGLDLPQTRATELSTAAHKQKTAGDHSSQGQNPDPSTRTPEAVSPSTETAKVGKVTI